MKKVLLITIFCISTSCFAQKFGVGVQSSVYTHGISAKFKMNDYNAIQAVASLVGPYSEYTARYMRGFQEHDIGSVVTFQPYAVGMVSLQTFYYKTYYYGASPYTPEDAHGVGFGIGGGTAWRFSAVDNLEVSAEIAYRTTTANLTHRHTNVVGTAYTYSAYTYTPIHIAFGAHYYFGN